MVNISINNQAQKGQNIIRTHDKEIKILISYNLVKVEQRCSVGTTLMLHKLKKFFGVKKHCRKLNKIVYGDAIIDDETNRWYVSK